MKYSKTDFIRADHSTIEIDQALEESGEEFLLNSDVKAIDNCWIRGSLYFDGKQLVSSRLELTGDMIVLDSITNEDLKVGFDTVSERLYSFTDSNAEDLDIYFAPQETIDLLPEIFDAITTEAPVGYSVLAREDYPSGEGWELVRDDEEEEKDEIDPRWAKLSELTFDD